MCKREVPGLFTDDGKWTIGGGTRGGEWLAKNGAVRCVMEESLEGNCNNWLVGIAEVETELGKAKDGISNQISVLVGVRRHS